ncbi:MFS transporter [Paenibacillus alvei]|uniref:MFS transporter n=1 Tax=Paenibacillus alvei TaxID=44250 RepID=UPI0013D98B95|nr:MFS transporter [Paenibacillus alvei]NEZ41126.1 MFS transporter [Paenibacillus alvei]
MSNKVEGLLTNTDFRMLWIGQTASQFGTQVALLGMPLVAALYLGASPMQMGLLGFAEYAPFIIFGLIAGVWIDRFPRRPILVAANFFRGALLLIVPLTALAGFLNMTVLYLVAFIVGICTVFFDVAYTSFLPSIVRKEQLVDGNSKLETSKSTAQIAGPGLSGGLEQLITAPFAILFTSASFFVSAVYIARIRKLETVVTDAKKQKNIWLEIKEGLHTVYTKPLLWGVVRCSTVFNLSWNVIFSIYVLYASQELKISASILGIIYGTLGVGYLTGSLLAQRAVRRFGVGPTIVGSATIAASGGLLAPLAVGSELSIALIMMLGQLLFGMGVSMFSISTISLRQVIVPDALQGRVNATFRFISWGSLPLGSLIGGMIGGAMGLRFALFAGGVGLLASACTLLFTPFLQLRVKSFHELSLEKDVSIKC